jgi:hypothetical protein
MNPDGVYGPQLEADKIAFLEELNAMQHGIHGEWLVCSDFNLIYKSGRQEQLQAKQKTHGSFQSSFGQPGA